MKGARGGNARNEGGAMGQWMKYKGVMNGARGGNGRNTRGERRGREVAMDEVPGGNEGRTRRQWIKHKGGMKKPRGGNG